MNIRRIKFLRRKSLFGKIIRLPFKLIPSSAVISILAGPLKKNKWIKGAHNISILLGTYERKQSAEFMTFSRNSQCFWDLGAHVGYYTLLYHASAPSGKIFAFEPVENNASLFKKHMSLNNIMDYKLFQVAVSDKEGSLSFRKTYTSVAGKLDEAGESKVNVVKLSTYLRDSMVEAPDLIKMDIEGAEVSVLTDLKTVLKENKPTLFVSTHGAKLHADCVSILSEIGYQLKPLDSNNMQTAKEILAFA